MQRWNKLFELPSVSAAGTLARAKLKNPRGQAETDLPRQSTQTEKTCC